MQNQHNEIARKIEKLREFWVEETGKRPDYKLARWLMFAEDVDLLVGLLKLESSIHGQLPEVFIIMLTPFKSQKDFSFHILKDWLNGYEMEKEKNSDKHFNWDYASFKTASSEAENTQSEDDLLVRMLNSFKENIDNRNLVFGIIPQSVTDFSEYNRWLNNLIRNKNLHDEIKILTLDHVGKYYLNKICVNNDDIAITLEPGTQDLHGAMQNIAVQGNPNDPQVQMRKIMFKMSEAISKIKIDTLYKLGEELIKIGQKSGQRSFFASMFLIYAGFLMHIKDTERIDELLNRATKIAKSGLPEQKDCVPVLIQLYAYKASNYALAKQYLEAVKWYKIQAKYCIENNFSLMAISAYKNAIHIADKYDLKEEHLTCSREGYVIGEQLQDDELKQSEYGSIAYHYYKILMDEEEPHALDVKQRMSGIYGPEWEENSEKLNQQLLSKKPMVT
jgi:hypothetical protein